MADLDTLVSTMQARGVARVYKLGEVPAKPTYPYAVVGLGTPDRVARTTDGRGADLHRATAQFFGHDIDGVLEIATKGDLDGARLPLSSSPLVERELGTSPYRDPDDQGVITILHTYRF